MTKKYVKLVERNFRDEEPNMTDVKKIIQCAADETLKTTYRKRTHKDNSIQESLWITDKIKANKVKEIIQQAKEKCIK